MILYPKAYFNKVSEITLEFAKKNNIKALILDVDNTLIDYYKKQKVQDVSNKLEIPYKYFAKKPFKSGFLKIQKELQEKPENIGVVGDQIFTDIIGGNRCKMFTILVEPIQEKDILITKWKRPIEEKIKKHFRQSKEK